MDGRKLNVELEKSRAAFWPCAIRGDPEVDAAALVAREKKEKEPAYKPDPNAEMVPKQVTDKETLRKLKAEFSHLDIPMGPDAHTTTHKNYAGGRKAFDWGALPTDDVGGDSSSAASSSSSAAKPAATVVAKPPASKSVAAASSTNGFEWGALPSTDADKAKKPIIEVASSHLPQTMEEAATDLLVPMKYSWGALPTDASLRRQLQQRRPLSQSLRHRRRPSQSSLLPTLPARQRRRRRRPRPTGRCTAGERSRFRSTGILGKQTSCVPDTSPTF